MNTSELYLKLENLLQRQSAIKAILATHKNMSLRSMAAMKLMEINSKISITKQKIELEERFFELRTQDEF